MQDGTGYDESWISPARRRWPTLFNAVCRIGQLEALRCFLLADARAERDILDMVDWALCDVDVRELEDLARGDGMLDDKEMFELRRAGRALWDLMGVDPTLVEEETAMRWLFIGRCHGALFALNRKDPEPGTFCVRCLAPARLADPNCSSCRGTGMVTLEWTSTVV